jgi:hypothetical protein
LDWLELLYQARQRMKAREAIMDLDCTHMAAAGCVSREGGNRMKGFRQRLMGQAGVTAGSEAELKLVKKVAIKKHQ